MRKKKWIIKTLSCVGLCFFMLSETVLADDKMSAEEFLKSKLDQVFAVLQKEDLGQPEKDDQIVEIVTPMFDFALMAKLSLGKKHWSGLSEENKERFTELFIKRLRRSYLNKFVLYTDEKIIYDAPVEVSEKIQIPTSLISKDKKISMVYKLYNPNNSWKIYDIEIQGVSIIRSYRAQFDEILQSGSIDDLLHKLEEPIDN
jgi:phospholipid transport system substrate-binding protein